MDTCSTIREVRKGYSKPTGSKCWYLLLVVMHANAHSATPHAGLHWAITCSPGVTKAADVCGTVGNTRESYTEL